MENALQSTTDLAGTSVYNDLFRGNNRAVAPALVNIINGLREYWPLTVRQVYYQAVAALILQNNLNEYRRVSKILTTLRREDIVPWHAIGDRTRRTIDKRGISDLQAFVQGQMESFLDPRYYHRCYIQEQSVYVEVLVEKDALAAIMEDAVWPYCTRLVVTRGHPSATQVNEIAERFDKAIMQARDPIILYFGDLDPSGVAIPRYLQESLYLHHNIDVDMRRIALQPEQAKAFNLPVSLDAAKTSDPNYSAWINRYGDQAPTELDALHPKDLTRLTEEALQSVYDMSEVDEQQQTEKMERDKLRLMRNRVQDFCVTEFPDVFKGVVV
ncbi:MAG: hypothetical protein K1563_07870 [Candidatus Thiodiazotropha sp. (ex. Lucinisca nassula)]|nr:hypothetical protein [Candidatus Thiodiazotropha sp. (ex. Lucinisca nassula)]MBW9273591.1 hypothetical protein [Candidatus Thiodiazotropha sp. (ex. Lucinisca nassula)]